VTSLNVGGQARRYLTPTRVAKISELPPDRTAPPEPSTTSFGENVEIPNVSPGQIAGLAELTGDAPGK
jgi:hypothetical protein